MKVVEKTGKTIDEAVNAALAELGVEREKVEIEILENPSKGFLGFFGAKPARIKVILQDSPSENAVNLLKSIVQAMDLQI